MITISLRIYLFSNLVLLLVLAAVFANSMDDIFIVIIAAAFMGVLFQAIPIHSFLIHSHEQENFETI